MAKITSEQARIAESNGISLTLLHNRIDRGWDVEKAMTEPLESDKTKTRHQKEKFKDRSTSFYSYGNNTVLRCPVPGCSHTGGIITKIHCRMAHGMERDEVKKKYGMPYQIGIDAQKRFENLKEGFN